MVRCVGACTPLLALEPRARLAGNFVKVAWRRQGKLEVWSARTEVAEGAP